MTWFSRFWTGDKRSGNTAEIREVSDTGVLLTRTDGTETNLAFADIRMAYAFQSDAYVVDYVVLGIEFASGERLAFLQHESGWNEIVDALGRAGLLASAPKQWQLDVIASSPGEPPILLYQRT